MNWTATILEHNEDGASMLVRYEREGYQSVTVGALLPPVGASLADHLAQYAPITAWAWEDDQRIPREAPEVGTVVSAPEPQPLPEAPAGGIPTIDLEPVA